MKVIAIDTFQPKGTIRPIRAGEQVDVQPATAREWLKDGLVIKASKNPETMPRKPDTEKAVRAPQETAVKKAPEKMVRKPRESR